MACAATRRRFPVGANPTRRTATGAVMEETKWLKPSDSGSRIGDRRECAGRNASERRARRKPVIASMLCTTKSAREDIAGAPDRGVCCIHRSLRGGAVRRDLPTGSNQTRVHTESPRQTQALGISTLKDRVCMTAAMPIFRRSNMATALGETPSWQWRRWGSFCSGATRTSLTPTSRTPNRCDLATGHRHGRSNKGAPGLDGQDFADIIKMLNKALVLA